MSLLVLLSMLLPEAMIYAAQEEKSSESLSSRKRERSETDLSDDEGDGSRKRVLHSYADEVITADKDFSAEYPVLAEGFDLIGLNFQEFMQARLVGHFAYESAGQATGTLLGNTINDAEAFLIERSVEFLSERLNQAILEKRALDQQARRVLIFAFTYRHFVGLDIQKGFDKSIITTKSLYEAVSGNNVQIVKLLLVLNKRFANLKDRQGVTLLMIAGKLGHTEIVGLLIQAGADINSINSEGESALMLAVSYDKFEVVNQLLAAGADTDVRYQYGYTLLSKAIKSRDTHIAKALISAGADVNVSTRYFGGSSQTVLMYAARGNDPELVARLITAGAHVNVADEFGCTAIMIAAEHNNLEIVEMLVAAGAEINHTDLHGKTVLMSAAHGSKKVAAQKIVDLLIRLGATVHAQDNRGNTALMYAAASGQDLVIDSLVAAGVNLETQNLSGETALFRAVKSDNKTAVKKLITHGANVNCTDRFGETALMLSYYEIAQLLINAGAHVNQQDLAGNSVLFNAVKESYRNDKKIRILMASGADETILNNEGQTVLDVVHDGFKKDLILQLIAERQAAHEAAQQQAAQLDSFEFNL